MGFGIDAQGRNYATGAGFYGTGATTSSMTYIDNSGTATLGANALPFLSALSFEFFNITSSTATSDKLIQTKIGSNNGIMEGHLLQSDGITWTSTPDLTIVPQAGNVNLVDGSGATVSTQTILNESGSYTVMGGSTESCKIKLSPTSQYITIFKFSAAKLPNFTAGSASFPNSALIPFNKFHGLTIQNGAITEIALNIDNEQTDNINSNFFSCNDVNGDGYADLVVYPYNDNGLPFVYLNNKSNGFRYIGQTNLPRPSLPYAGTNAVTSIYQDVDGDVIADLLIFPGNPFNPSGVISYKFFKGLRPIG